MITDNKQALNFDSIGSQKGQLVFLSFIMATDNISKRTMYNPAKFQVKFRNEAIEEVDIKDTVISWFLL